MDLESEQAQATIAELIAHLDRLNQSTQNEMLELGIDETTVTGVASSLEQEANAERRVEEATRSANQARDEATNSMNKSITSSQTSSTLAAGLSTLFITTTGFNLASNAFINTKRVCGIVPS